MMDNFKPGDVIAFGGTSLLGAFINLVTFGLPFSSAAHVGIIGEHNGRLRLFESTVDAEHMCCVRKVAAPGVKAVSIKSRIDRYIGKVWHYPLSRMLYNFERSRLTWFLLSMIGRDYDDMGAVRAGGWLLAKTKASSGRADLSRLFCSELVAAAHSEVGVYSTGNASGYSPNSLLRAERLAGVLKRHKRIK